LIDCNEERCWQQQRGGGGTWQWEEVRVGNGDDGYWWPWAVVTMGSGEDGKWWNTGRFDSCTWLSREVVKRSGWEGVTTRCGEEGAWRREGKLSSGLMRKESGEEGKRCRRQVLNGKGRNPGHKRCVFPCKVGAGNEKYLACAAVAGGVVPGAIHSLYVFGHKCLFLCARVQIAL
jgi:hypothetical protein